MIQMLKKAAWCTAIARAAVVVAVAAPVVLVGSQAAEASWDVQTVPTPPGASSPTITGVSCPTATACIAVGQANSGAVSFAEAWDGTSWTVMTSPDPVDNFLVDVSCTSPIACTAVGRSFNGQAWGPLAERWDGTSWTVQSVPFVADSILTGVSCTSATSCLAVGQAGNVDAFSESWNGTTWTESSAPVPSGDGQTYFTGVSCTSGQSCMAVGEVFFPSYVPLAESWNGSNWAVLATPLPTGATEGRFLGVSCSSASACIAVGAYNDGSAGSPNRALAESWNGSGWTPQITPALGNSQSSGFDRVSCSRTARCTAVGFVAGSIHQQALAEHWNGTSWTWQGGTTPDNARYSSFYGVSCMTKAACTAVGNYQIGSGPLLALAEQHDS